MKASELIKELEGVIAREGDVPVLVTRGNWDCVPASNLAVVEEFSDEIPLAVTLEWKELWEDER